jgi:hypothetical protein
MHSANTNQERSGVCPVITVYNPAFHDWQ